MANRRPKISVIGAGAVGSALALALHEKGYPVVSVISRSGSDAIDLARLVKSKKASTNVADIDPATQIALVTVTDGAISQVSQQLAKAKRIRIRQLFAFHCSGVLSADALAPLRAKGALVAAVHPIQTFPSVQRAERLKSKLRGIYYGIDGEPEALAKAEEIVRDLEGRAVVVPKEFKELYHVACIFASNYMVVFLNAISDLSRTIGLKAAWTEVFGPLMTTTMENVVKGSAPWALTGPIIRGDMPSIELHLKSLQKFTPQLLPLYTINGIELARLAKQNNRITQSDFDSIISAFRSTIRSLSPPTKGKT